MIPSAGRSGSSSNIDFSLLKLDSQQRLLNLLGKFDGTKVIVWDDKLIGPFEFVANASILRKHDAIRLIRLSDIKLISYDSSNADYTLFFLRKDIQLAKPLAEVLQRLDRVSLSKTCLVFVPQRCMSIEKLLEYNKVDLSKLNSIEELPIELFPLDTDMLSMENESVFRDIHLNDDLSAIHQIVEGIMKLQKIYGQIPRISGRGKAAKMVQELLLKRREPESQASRSLRSKNPKIHQLILIDRKIDLLTPMLTQLTYEGLLDELFGIHSGVITLPEKKNNQPKQDKTPEIKGPKKFELRSSEELYAKLRDCHINAIADTLKQSAKKLQADYDECNSEGKTIHEMGKIVKRLQHLKNARSSQSNHVTIAELVNEQTLKPEFIFGLRIEHDILQEDGIYRIIPDIDLKLLRQESVIRIIRLICVQSIVSGGLKPKICDYYKREIIQNYGFEYLMLLSELEKAEILRIQDKVYEEPSFRQLRSKSELIIDNFDESNPNHFSYVYGGYAPISVMQAQSELEYTDPSNEESRTVLVFFIGGCTFAEISAFRYLAQREDSNCGFIVGTTKIINGKSFIDSLWPIGYSTKTR